LFLVLNIRPPSLQNDDLDSKQGAKMSNKRLDLSNKRFGRLIALSVAGNDESGRVLWKFKCDCGSELIALGSRVNSGRKLSCGCLVRDTASNTQKTRRKANTVSEYINHRVSIDETTGCWNWLGKLDKDGYGEFFFNNTKSRAHRSVYEHFIGQIPAGLIACHKCDNPSCVNPDHIFLGTSKDNAIDARDKGRAFVGEKNGRSKLTRQDVDSIRHSKEKQSVLAEKHGVDRHTISAIRRGDTWK